MDLTPRIRKHLLYIACVVAAAGTMYVVHSHALPSSMKDLFTATISLTGISVGFVATAKAVLLTIGSSPAINRLKQHGSFQNLIDYSLAVIHWSFVLGVLSAAGVLIDWTYHPWWHTPFMGAWSFWVVGSALAYYRLVRMYSSALTSNFEPPSDKP